MLIRTIALICLACMAASRSLPRAEDHHHVVRTLLQQASPTIPDSCAPFVKEAGSDAAEKMLDLGLGLLSKIPFLGNAADIVSLLLGFRDNGDIYVSIYV